MEVHTITVEREAIGQLATLCAYKGESRSAAVRRVAAHVVGGDADKDLLTAVAAELRSLADDGDSRVVWATHPSDDRHDGTETDRPKRLQLRRWTLDDPR